MNHFHLPENSHQDWENLVVLWSMGSSRKRRVLAAVEFIKQHPNIKNVIFTGGKTLWESEVSEAQEMQELFDHKFPHHELKILLEEEACDTEDNAEKTIHLLQETFSTYPKEILLLSDTSHLPRAWWAFERRGVDVKRIMSEYWLAKRSPHHKKYLQKLLVSSEFLKQTFMLEPLLHILTLFENGRKFIRTKTQNRIK